MTQIVLGNTQFTVDEFLAAMREVELCPAFEEEMRQWEDFMRVTPEMLQFVVD